MTHIRSPSFNLNIPHLYEFMNGQVNEARFEYDGSLPQINSKYRKQSIDIDLRKISPREKQQKTRIQPEPPKIIKYDLVDQKIVNDVVFSSRRLTEIR